MLVEVILPLNLPWIPVYNAPEDIVRGQRVRVRCAGRSYIGVVWKTNAQSKLSPEKIHDIDQVLASIPAVTENELKFWDFLSQYYMCPIGDVLMTAYPVVKTKGEETISRERERKAKAEQKRLELLGRQLTTLKERLAKKEAELNRKHGIAVMERLQSERQKLFGEIQRIEQELNVTGRCADASPDGESQVPEYRPVVLSAAQAKAAQQCESAFTEGKPALLHGITGAGKTEIYLEFARKTLLQGKKVLYLVPEIALSSQMEKRLEYIFGDDVYTFHSAESTAYRREVAEAARSPKPCIVLGTRSSLFLPFDNLGLIIIDEEHDSSYKSDSAPRLNARDSAVMLANIHSCPIILGSATPSLESLYNASKGIYRQVELTERFYQGDEPDIEIIDSIAERRKNGFVGSLSRKLINHIATTLQEHRQVIVFRSRRAFSPVLQCDSCGSILKCPHCNVSLSLHKDSLLRCHFCGYSTQYREDMLCGKCSGHYRPMGAGTQKIEEELTNLFPESRVARLDSDSVSRSQKIIQDFADGKTDILVGTQMVTKGFDFSGLALVCVINADSMLSQQDFRADERALQLLDQFRGRCSRRGEKGLFVIQTAQASHPIFQSWNNADSVSRILSERQMFLYPPYTRMLTIILRDSNEPRINLMSQALGKALRGMTGANKIIVEGPYSPDTDKLADKWIRHIRIILTRDSSLGENKKRIRETIDRFETERRYPDHIIIDVDPL